VGSALEQRSILDTRLPAPDLAREIARGGSAFVIL
jgi:hypothetical protein